MFEGQIKKLEDKNIGSWLYASGRLASIEEKLMPDSLMESVFQSKSEGEIMSKISAYYQADNLADALLQAEKDDYYLFLDIAAEAVYPEFLLLPHEAHNLRRVLKKRLSVKLRPGESETPAEEAAQGFEMPYYYGPDELRAAVDIHMNAEKPEEANDDNLPFWMNEALRRGVKRYRATDDASVLGIETDKALWREIFKRLDETGNECLKTIFVLQADLINLSTVLRIRKLSVKPEAVAERFIEGASFTPAEACKTASVSESEFKDAFAALLAKMSGLDEEDRVRLMDVAVNYDEKGAGVYTSVSDSIEIKFLKEAMTHFGSPEKVYAYFRLRVSERKNLRIAYAAASNNLDPAFVKELIRPQFRSESI